MPLENLKKEAHIVGENGLWGVFNNVAVLTCSNDGYLLTIAKPGIGRLDDMSAAEEKAYWDFTFTNAAAGIETAEGRGMDTSLSPKSTKPSVLCAMNDGTAAWQNVGTTHCHVVWTHTPSAIGDMQEHLENDRRFFSGDPNYAPLATATVDLKAPDFSDRIRNVRSIMRRSFESASPLSYSIYMKEPSQEDPRNGSQMVIEAWTPERHAIGSISQFIRYWNGLWETPINTQGIGLKYAAFTHD